jgi:ABC-type multidrug transport system ATPase subunit
VGTKLRGDILINGITVPPARLADRVALVERDISFTPDMSVRQTLLFHSLMREPGTLTRGRDTKGRINALIEDLGLSQVKHTRVADLTVSEKQRLNVACHLLLDTDIVLLDQPTEGMDIFDTFFLVEYLRQWAARGRIVILTMHPPTYEIFTMISKVITGSYLSTLYNFTSCWTSPLSRPVTEYELLVDPHHELWKMLSKIFFFKFISRYTNSPF